MSMKLMVRVLEEADLTRPQQAVLLSMAENAKDDGSMCFPSIDLIAWKAGYKPRNVVDIIRDLRSMGVLTVVKEATAQRPTEYRIHLNKAPKKQTFEEWQAANGRHTERPKRELLAREIAPLQARENAPLSETLTRENAPQGCNLDAQGVQSHVSLAREIAPEPVSEPVRTSHITSQLPRNGAAQTLVAVLYEDILGIGKPTNYGQAVGQAQKLVAAGCDPEELTRIALWLMGDSWHVERGITMTTVMQQRDKWRAAQRRPVGELRVHQGGRADEPMRGGFAPPRDKRKGYSADELAERAIELERMGL